MPRRRWVGSTPTQVTPAQGSSPPGIERSNAYAPANPTGRSPSNAASARDGGRIFCSRSQSWSVTGSKVSPGLYESLELLGKDESLARLTRAAGDVAA